MRLCEKYTVKFICYYIYLVCGGASMVSFITHYDDDEDDEDDDDEDDE